MMAIIYNVKARSGDSMKVSREQVAENRRRILEAAGRLFRERGFEAVSVAEIMKAAGLTHGGFYGYFRSKDDLIGQAVADALGDTAAPSADLATYAADYLTAAHRDDLAGGCATAGLAAETIRQAPGARSEMTAGLRRQIDRLARTAPGATPSERREAAIGSWAAMVGAMILARMSDDPDLSEDMLDRTRAWIAAKSAARRLRRKADQSPR
jgi:TetR/AcrR family transcriptional regulator, transcriptional repressor for nem operon